MRKVESVGARTKVCIGCVGGWARTRVFELWGKAEQSKEQGSIRSRAVAGSIEAAYCGLLATCQFPSSPFVQVFEEWNGLTLAVFFSFLPFPPPLTCVKAPTDEPGSTTLSFQ